jgi:hypothetical protein
MCKYLSKVIEDFPEEITGVSAKLAADHLFKVREDGRKLSKEQANVFPPYNVPTAVCGKQSLLRYSDGGVIPNYASASPW